jgi:protein-S-isoprenylcysteine O-methyltransferase Ste14
MENQADRAGVVILPPLLMLIALLVVIVLHWLWPLRTSMWRLAVAVGIILGALGIGSMAWGRKTLVKGGTNVSPLKPVTGIITDGPYRYTRNPLYIGVMSLFIGLSLIIGTWWGFVVLVPVFLILHYGVILREESILSRNSAIVTSNTNAWFAGTYNSCDPKQIVGSEPQLPSGCRNWRGP